MKRSSLLAVLLWAFTGTAGAAERLNIVTTLPSLGSIARAVAGDRAEVFVLARPGQDPHFIDPKPSFIVKLRDADVFVVNGLDLEVGWAPSLVEGSRNREVQPGGDGYFDASTAVTVIDLPSGPVDRAQGDVHPLGNPHYTLDPLALRAVAGALADRLARIDPSSAADYAARSRAWQKKLDVALFGAEVVDEVGGAKLARELEGGRLDAFLAENGLTERLGGWTKKLSHARGKPVVAFHTNMNYLWRRFGLVLVATVEPKPGIPPSAGHVADVVGLVRAKKVTALVTQPFYDDSAVKLVAEKTGAAVVKVDLEGDDALAVVDTIVGRVAEAVR